MSKQISKQNKPAKILVVDDKEQMREVLRKFLAAEKYVVETAENAVETLKKFDETRFDVVLSDTKMPGMDGTELLDEILKKDANFALICRRVVREKSGATGCAAKKSLILKKFCNQINSGEK